MWLTILNRILTGKAFEKRQRAAALQDASRLNYAPKSDRSWSAAYSYPRVIHRARRALRISSPPRPVNNSAPKKILGMSASVFFANP